MGDLRGVRARLDHLAWLGVDALWLSPIYPSPMPTSATTSADYTGRRPGLRHARRLRRADGRGARERGLRRAARHRALPHLDRAPVVPRAPRLVHLGATAEQLVARRSAGPPGRALGGRYYLHSFYPEQPDLDWRNPEVVAAMQDVLRFWLERGVDGYRDRRDRPAAEGRAAARRPAGRRAVRAAAERGRGAARAHELAQRARHGGGARADPRGGGRRLPRRRGLPAERALAALPRPLRRRRSRSSCCRRPWEAGALRAAIEATTSRTGRGVGACRTTTSAGSATRFGRENARAAALLLLTLPGPAFLYQGDEIGQLRRAAGRERATTAPAATATATRCSGTARRRRASAPASLAAAGRRGRAATWRTSARDPGSTLSLVRDADRAAPRARARASSCSTPRRA